MRALKAVWFAPLLILLGACESAGVRHYEATADRLGLVGRLEPGAGFDHRVYLNPAATATGSRPLHLYIDGDGIPWHGPGRPALEPTARNPLVLRLMAQDPGPAAYIGRPCYLGAYDADACHPWVWTHGRYAQAVVDSMVAAATRVAAQLRARELVLIGYSGGGSLAMLMAPRMDRVTAVVTLAANLDLEAWVAAHGYSPLTGSLDPAREPALPSHIRQMHWVGAEDRQVPPQIVRKGLTAQQGADVEVIPALDHACCWESVWPDLLQRIAADSQVSLRRPQGDLPL